MDQNTKTSPDASGIPEFLKAEPKKPATTTVKAAVQARAAKTPADPRVVEAAPKAKKAKGGKRGAAERSGIVAPAAHRSIIPARYKKTYAATNDTCGTRLALALKAATTVLNADGRPSLDVKALWAIAKENAIDVKPYEGLNNGQKRMNVGNKMAGLLKAGEKVTVNGKVFATAETALRKDPPKVEVKAKTPRKPKAQAEPAQPTA